MCYIQEILPVPSWENIALFHLYQTQAKGVFLRTCAVYTYRSANLYLSGLHCYELNATIHTVFKEGILATSEARHTPVHVEHT